MAIKYLQCSNAIAREEEGEVLLFEHREEGNAKISLLNSTAYAIWDLCNGENTLDDITTIFVEKFSNVKAEKIESDIKVFIDKMVERGWLEIENDK